MKKHKVEIYFATYCPYCRKALDLLNEKLAKRNDVEYVKIDVTDADRSEMISRSGRRTVPQIFINDTHIGGCDDLHVLKDGGELDKFLE